MCGWSCFGLWLVMCGGLYCLFLGGLVIGVWAWFVLKVFGSLSFV